jgi:hypothetical protein
MFVSGNSGFGVRLDLDPGHLAEEVGDVLAADQRIYVFEARRSHDQRDFEDRLKRRIAEVRPDVLTVELLIEDLPVIRGE